MDCNFELSYSGSNADEHVLQFYDIARALPGFERTISLTTHLLLHDQIRTQSPSTKGFYILAIPPEAGSWKIKVGMALGTLGAGVGAFGLAPPDTMFGWLAKSAVEYVVEETLGFSPNYDETLGRQIKKFNENQSKLEILKEINQSRFDGVIEKCEEGIKEIHRPISSSETAKFANINWQAGGKSGKFDGNFSKNTFDYLDLTVTAEEITEFDGSISSYNSNTSNGRIFIPDERRTIPFKLSQEAQSYSSIDIITRSLRANALSRKSRDPLSGRHIRIEGFRKESQNGRLKSLFITDVSSSN